MIDFIEMTFACKHLELGNIITYTNITSGEVNKYRSKGRINNIYKNSLMLKSENDGQHIKIKGNFVKFLQGHNLFGSNNLVGIAHEVVTRVLKQLDIPITEAELANIKNGCFIVHMVDVAWGYRHEAKLIPKMIDEVGGMWRLRGKDVSNYSDETVYLNQHSKKFAFKLYNKKSELAHRALPLNLPGRERLLKYADGLLRSELRLYSKALRELGLNRGEDWSVSKVKELIKLALEQAEFSGSIFCRIIPENIMQLKPKLRQAYFLWEDGHDLESLYGQQVLRRLRKAFADIDIDINNSPPTIESQEVNIAKSFSEENKLNYPKWALKFGLIHIPKK